MSALSYAPGAKRGMNFAETRNAEYLQKTFISFNDTPHGYKRKFLIQVVSGAFYLSILFGLNR